MADTERLLGELDGKMELALQKLDKINGTIARHGEWIAAHEQEHKSAGRAWNWAWQIFTPFLGAVLGVIGGYISTKARR